MSSSNPNITTMQATSSAVTATVGTGGGGGASSAVPVSTTTTTSTPSPKPTTPTPQQRKKKNPLQHLLAGGCAGLVETSICHPLDTIKTRMQLRRQSNTLEAVRARSSLREPGLMHSLMEPALKRTSLSEPKVVSTTKPGGGGLHEPSLKLGVSETQHVAKVTHIPRSVPGTVAAPLGPIGTANRIIRREGFFALYKGLTAVYTGIIPKMAIRFLSFEQYREGLQSVSTSMGYPAQGGNATFTPTVTFFAGLASGLTEAIMVVTPAEVCKIRMQSQYHSLIDPSQVKHRKYTNVIQTAITIVREEGLGALYKGVVPTMLRQGCNQAVNFSVYNGVKRYLLDKQPGKKELEHWQSLLLGGISGGMGPMVNNPLDVVKTRMQKQVITPGKPPKYTGLIQSCVVIAKEEGTAALWKGITPRLLRIMPGQAITFMTYEAVSSRLNRWGVF